MRFETSLFYVVATLVTIPIPVVLLQIPVSVTVTSVTLMSVYNNQSYFIYRYFSHCCW